MGLLVLRTVADFFAPLGINGLLKWVPLLWAAVPYKGVLILVADTLRPTAKARSCVQSSGFS